jgi:hypothetical protein
VKRRTVMLGFEFIERRERWDEGLLVSGPEIPGPIPPVAKQDKKLNVVQLASSDSTWRGRRR